MRRNLLPFIGALSLILIAYQLALQYNFTGQYILQFEPKTPMYEHSSDGRFVGALITWITWSLGMNETHFWTHIISMVLLAAGVVLLYRRILDEFESPDQFFSIVTFVCCYLVVANVFIVEMFAIGSIMACTAHFLVIRSAIELSRPVLTPRARGLAFLFALLGVCTYQATISFLIPLTVILLLISRQSPATILKRTALGLGFYVTGVVVSLLWVHQIHPLVFPFYPARVHSIVWSNFTGLLRDQPVLWLSAFEILPKGVFPVFLAAGLALLLWARTSIKPFALACIVGALLVIVILSLAPQLMFLWLTARSTIPIGSLPALMAICALVFGPAANSRYRTSVAVFTGLWLLVTLSSANLILADRRHTDLEDREIARIFLDQITLHETQTSSEIKKIGLAVDKAAVWCYPGVHCYADLNTRCLNASYCFVSLMRVMSGRNFAFANFEPKDVPARFGKDNWNTFSVDQIRFEGDTAYIAAY